MQRNSKKTAFKMREKAPKNDLKVSNAALVGNAMLQQRLAEANNKKMSIDASKNNEKSHKCALMSRPTTSVTSAPSPTRTLATRAVNLASMLLLNLLPTATSTSIAAPTTVATPASSVLTTIINGAIEPTLLKNVSPIHAASDFATHSPPSIANLVANSAEDLSNFRDVTFDIFDDNDNLFGSPLAFDDSENGLWNGRFVPPPPRPPFLVDDTAILSDGLTTCDLCSWAMPTKSTFIFEGTIEKASELGWPLTLIIVSVFSAIIGAIIMVTVVRCRRKKATNNRNENHVQWWSRNKRPTNSSSSTSSSNNNNHLRRNNIYTAHPADSIRGLHQQPQQQQQHQHQPSSSLSTASTLTAITASSSQNAAAVATTSLNIDTPSSSSQHHQLGIDEHQSANQPHHSQRQQQRLGQHLFGQHHHHHHHQHHQPFQYYQQPQQHTLFRQRNNNYDCFDDDDDGGPQDYQHHHQLHHQHLHQQQHATMQHQRPASTSLSLSTSSLASTPSPLTLNGSTMLQHQPQQHNQQQQQLFHEDAGGGIVAATAASSCHWPNTTMLLAS